VAVISNATTYAVALAHHLGVPRTGTQLELRKESHGQHIQALCFRRKEDRAEKLAGSWGRFSQSTFYTDSITDLPPERVKPRG
jgi:phosphoserine phosphatase